MDEKTGLGDLTLQKSLEYLNERQGEIKREIEALHLHVDEYGEALKAEFRQNMLTAKEDVRNVGLELQRVILGEAEARLKMEHQEEAKANDKMCAAQREAIDYHFAKAREFERDRHSMPEVVADKRDFFAAHALQALIRNDKHCEFSVSDIARDAYHYADAMLVAQKGK